MLLLNDKIIVKMRLCLDKDIKTLVNIDQCQPDNPSVWDESDFKHFKKGMNNVALVADIAGTPVGYLFLELTKNKARIVRCMVSAAIKRHYIGSQLIDRAKNYLKKDRICLYAEIDEYNVAAQLFLQKHSFRANEIVNDYGAQAYVMEYFQCN